MKILFFDAGIYIYDDVVDCLRSMGHDVRTVYYHFADRYEDSYFEGCFREKVLKSSCEVVFSINFHPLVAMVSKELSIPYISWSYDSPLPERLSEYFSYDTNHIYLFDRYEVERLRTRGFSNVHHMQLASNAGRLDKLVFLKRAMEKYSAEISFVGQLYSSLVLPGLMNFMDEYSQGYIDGILTAQMETFGADILWTSVTDELMTRVNSRTKERKISTPLTKTGLVFAIQKQITFAERVTLISTFGEYFDTRYYSTEDYDFGTGVKKMGPVRYFDEMPAVFRFSKLNLCPTIRSIITGIPLRAIDVMAAGGALLSNYQVELAESFKDGMDCIMYSSVEEAFDKAAYYLKHEDERNKIAQNGHRIVGKEFRYEDRLKAMLSKGNL